MILAGVDSDGPSIYGIFNPGWLECFNSIGFHAIGSGREHAIGSLIETYKPKDSGIMSLYSVFRAKKNAEIAPGVGKLSDFGTVSSSVDIKYFNEKDEIMNKLENLHKKEEESRTQLINSLRSVKIEKVIEQVSNNE